MPEPNVASQRNPIHSGASVNPLAHSSDVFFYRLAGFRLRMTHRIADLDHFFHQSLEALVLLHLCAGVFKCVIRNPIGHGLAFDLAGENYDLPALAFEFILFNLKSWQFSAVSFIINNNYSTISLIFGITCNTKEYLFDNQCIEIVHLSSYIVITCNTKEFI